MQLQVLYTQLIQLINHWGKHNLEVEEYIPGDRLRLAYWYSSPMNLILDMHCSITISALPSISTLVCLVIIRLFFIESMIYAQLSIFSIFNSAFSFTVRKHSMI